MIRMIRGSLVALTAAVCLGGLGCGPTEKDKTPNPDLGPPPSIPPGRTGADTPGAGGKGAPANQAGNQANKTPR
jgi:hypothetical protein